jgi:hypothetical protein
MKKNDFKKLRTYFKDNLGRFVSKVLAVKAQTVYKSKKTKMLNRLLKHPISIEISNRTAQSSYLNGYGTLYGFLGFDSTTQPNPVSSLYTYLEENIQPVYIQSPDGLSLKVIIKVPTYQEMRLDSSLSLPWGDGMSWPEALEVGIDGFGHFMASYKRPLGRSNQGIQVKNKIRSNSVIQTNYLKDIYKNDTDFGP